MKDKKEEGQKDKKKEEKGSYKRLAYRVKNPFKGV